MATAIPTIASADPQIGRFTGEEHRPLMAMVEITGKCNMACPICFAGTTSPAVDVPFEKVRRRIDRLVEDSGIIPLQISGGEPTLSENLIEIIAYARQRGFKNIELVTNGIKISRDHNLLPLLAEKGLTAVYLQFDGLSESSHIRIRGSDMREVRRRAVAAIRSAGLCCTLAVAVTRGVNDTELGEVVRYAIQNIDTVRAINFQSAVRFSGRFEGVGESRGYRLNELISLIEHQTGIGEGGFLTGVLGHYHCNGASLVYAIEDRLEPLFKHLSREKVDEFLGSDRRQTILDLFQGKAKFIGKHLLHPRTWKLLAEAAAIFGPIPRPKTILEARHLLLFAKSFMEREDVSCDRLQKCVYAMATDDGPVSFCAYNHFHRFSSRSME